MPLYQFLDEKKEIGELVRMNNLIYRVTDVIQWISTISSDFKWRHHLVRATPEEECVAIVLME